MILAISSSALSYYNLRQLHLHSPRLFIELTFNIQLKNIYAFRMLRFPISLAVLLALLLQLTSTSASKIGAMLVHAQSRRFVEHQSFPSTNVQIEHVTSVDPYQNTESSTRILLASTENKEETTHDMNNPKSMAADRDLKHDFNFEPKPNYKEYQPKSAWTRGQKIGVSVLFLLTVALATYTCALRHQLSTMNVYSLLGRGTNTAEDDEEKVGNAYGINRSLEML